MLYDGLIPAYCSMSKSGRLAGQLALMRMAALLDGLEKLFERKQPWMEKHRNSQPKDHEEQNATPDQEPAQALALAKTLARGATWGGGRGRLWLFHWGGDHLGPEGVCFGFFALGFFWRDGRWRHKMRGGSFALARGRGRNIGHVAQEPGDLIFGGGHPSQISQGFGWVGWLGCAWRVG